MHACFIPKKIPNTDLDPPSASIFGHRLPDGMVSLSLAVRRALFYLKFQMARAHARGCRAPFSRNICRLRVRKFLFASTLACERKIFGVIFWFAERNFDFSAYVSDNKNISTILHVHRTLENKREFCVIAIGSAYLPLGNDSTLN